MAQQNYYKANLRDLSFLLFEQFHLEELLGKEPYANWGKDEVLAVLEEAYGWAQKYLGPFNAIGDDDGCRLENGQVKAPPGFKEAWKALFKAGWRTLAIDEKHGGQAGPFTLAMMVEEFMCGVEHVVQHVPGAHAGRGRRDPRVRHARAAGDVRAEHVQRQVGGHDVPDRAAGRQRRRLARRRRRRKRADGTYDIQGTKIFISGGDHDMTDNIVHMVLARTPDAPPGTKGLSLFIVPEDRASTARRTTSRSPASSTRWASRRRRPRSSCSARTAAASASSSAPIEQKGMSQMFHLMNYARIGVGIQGLVARVVGVPQRARLREGSQAGQLDQAVEGRDRAARADHRARRRQAHAARHEVARRRHPRARREADDAHRSRQRAREDRRRQDADRVPPGPGRPARAAASRRTAATRRSRSARPRSRSTAAPASSRTGRSSSTAATRRSSRSTRARTTSRRWTSSAAS